MERPKAICQSLRSHGSDILPRKWSVSTVLKPSSSLTDLKCRVCLLSQQDILFPSFSNMCCQCLKLPLYCAGMSVKLLVSIPLQPFPNTTKSAAWLHMPGILFSAGNKVHQNMRCRQFEVGLCINLNLADYGMSSSLSQSIRSVDAVMKKWESLSVWMDSVCTFYFFVHL